MLVALAISICKYSKVHRNHQPPPRITSTPTAFFALHSHHHFRPLLTPPFSSSASTPFSLFAPVVIFILRSHRTFRTLLFPGFSLPSSFPPHSLRHTPRHALPLSSTSAGLSHLPYPTCLLPLSTLFPSHSSHHALLSHSSLLPSPSRPPYRPPF